LKWWCGFCPWFCLCVVLCLVICICCTILASLEWNLLDHGIWFNMCNWIMLSIIYWGFLHLFSSGILIYYFLFFFFFWCIISWFCC
jgi:hypothetical protein